MKTLIQLSGQPWLFSRDKRTVTDDRVQEKLDQIQKSAKRRGYECTLTPGNVRKLLEENTCQYTGVPFGGAKDKRSFDRVDNEKGYVPGNVIPVTEIANQLKGDADIHVIKQGITRYAKAGETRTKNIHNQITHRIAKIKKKEEHLESFIKSLERDKALLGQLNLEKEQILRKSEEDLKHSKILQTIVERLESDTDLASKYLTFWQRVRISYSEVTAKLRTTLTFYTK